MRSVIFNQEDGSDITHMTEFRSVNNCTCETVGLLDLLQARYLRLRRL